MIGNTRRWLRSRLSAGNSEAGLTTMEIVVWSASLLGLALLAYAALSGVAQEWINQLQN